MAKTKDKLYDTADTMRPYVDRALHDDDLHDNLKEAFNAARQVYQELLGGRNVTATAMRAATDKEIQENLKKTVEELRTAANRIQGKADHGARNTMLLLAGITAGLLFNPMTGPQTRKWLMDKIAGEGMDDYTYTPPVTPTASEPLPTT
jgi:gas vesicle protein